MPAYSDILAGFILELNFRDIPPEVVHSVKLHLLDSLGISLASGDLETTRIAVELVRGMGGKPESSLLGFPDKVPAVNAALANGVMAHSFDYDDTHSATLIHASACIAPAAFSAAEAGGLSGRETIVLAAIGYEIITRLGLVAPGKFHARGFHTTSVCGTLAAAAMGARAFSLSGDQAANALGIAGSQASGLLQCVKDGTFVKLLHPGWAGHGGLMAATLAKMGFTGPREVFEGELGFYNSFLHGQRYPLDPVVSGLGARWETPLIAIKLYPVCHFIQAYLDCVFKLKDEYRIDSKHIAGLECLVPAGEAPIICEPKEAKQRPTTEYGMRFSLYYCMAAALLEDSFNLHTVHVSKLGDPRYIDMASKVSYTVTEFPGFPELLPGWVKISLLDGTVLERKVDSCKGPFGEPITEKDVIKKFRDNIGGLYSPGQQDGIVNMVLEMDRLDNIGELFVNCIVRN